MRTIEFRGKRADNGEWVYGYVDATMYKDIVVIHTETGTFGVDPNTVCQFTGWHDCNGKQIYEGDIISLNPRNYKTLNVYWNDRMCNFLLVNDDTVLDMYKDDENHYNVIGNIHDNHELLKGGEKW